MGQDDSRPRNIWNVENKRFAFLIIYITIQSRFLCGLSCLQVAQRDLLTFFWTFWFAGAQRLSAGRCYDRWPCKTNYHSYGRWLLRMVRFACFHVTQFASYFDSLICPWIQIYVYRLLLVNLRLCSRRISPAGFTIPQLSWAGGQIAYTSVGAAIKFNETESTETESGLTPAKKGSMSSWPICCSICDDQVAFLVALLVDSSSCALSLSASTKWSAGLVFLQ